MKTMILDNNIDNILIYQSCGVDRIFIDLEILNKQERQGGLDTVISNHTIDDVISARQVVKTSELLVRVNPINSGSAAEIEGIISAGADIIMLPMFKRKDEVEEFINIVDGRVKTSLLLETAQALSRLDDILTVDGIDEIHIGLNDLHLSLGLDFMFELMSGTLLEYVTGKIKMRGIPFGIGGVSTIGNGKLDASIIIKEHVRLGSTRVILSRDFKKHCETKDSFLRELNNLTVAYNEACNLSLDDLESNKVLLKDTVKSIVN